MTAKICRWAVGFSGAIWLMAVSSLAFAQSSVLSNPNPTTGTQEESPATQMIPGVDNDDLAFVVLMLVLLAGLIWIWIRGQRMSAEASLNRSILDRAASRQVVRMSDDDIAEAKKREQDERDPDIQSMVSQRMGLRRSD